MSDKLATAVHALLNVLTIPSDAPAAVQEAERKLRELLYGPQRS